MPINPTKKASNNRLFELYIFNFCIWFYKMFIFKNLDSNYIIFSNLNQVKKMLEGGDVILSKESALKGVEPKKNWRPGIYTNEYKRIFEKFFCTSR